MSAPKPSAPIPGSARDRMQKQAERMLPGIGTLEPERAQVPKARPVRGAWGEAASAGGFALALTLRSKAFKWTVRVLTLVLWFVLPAALSAVLTVVVAVWVVSASTLWLRRTARPKKTLDKCQCGH